MHSRHDKNPLSIPSADIIKLELSFLSFPELSSIARVNRRLRNISNALTLKPKKELTASLTKTVKLLNEDKAHPTPLPESKFPMHASHAFLQWSTQNEIVLRKQASLTLREYKNSTTSETNSIAKPEPQKISYRLLERFFRPQETPEELAYHRSVYYIKHLDLAKKFGSMFTNYSSVFSRLIDDCKDEKEIEKISFIKFLKSLELDPELQKSASRQMLISLAWRPQHNFFKIAFDFCEKINAFDKDDYTMALAAAVTTSRNNAIGVLLTRGADPNYVFKDDHKQSLLIETIKHSNTEGIRLLLLHGATNLQVKDADLKTAFDYAEDKPEIKKLLLAKNKPSRNEVPHNTERMHPQHHYLPRGHNGC